VVCRIPNAFPCKSRPSFECLSLCVLPAQREFGLPGRDCRTTKMRERDARGVIVANAAQLRLCVKTVIARLAQSAGTGGRICKAEKSKTRDTSDTQFVADRGGFELSIRAYGATDKKTAVCLSVILDARPRPLVLFEIILLLYTVAVRSAMLRHGRQAGQNSFSGRH